MTLLKMYFLNTYITHFMTYTNILLRAYVCTCSAYITPLTSVNIHVSVVNNISVSASSSLEIVNITFPPERLYMPCYTVHTSGVRKFVECGGGLYNDNLSIHISLMKIQK